MRKKMKEISAIVLKSGDKLLCFEILYRAIGQLFLFPLIRSGLAYVPEILGVSYLSQQNAILLLRSPAALLWLIGLLLIVAFYLLFEIVALLSYCEAGWQRQKISFVGIWRAGFRHTASLFHPKRIGVLLFALPLLLSVFSVASGWLRSVRIPEFILDYIYETPLLFWVYVGGILVCHLLLFLYLFGVPDMIFQGTSFKESWRESRRLLRGSKLRVLGRLLQWSVLFTLAGYLLSSCVILVFGLYARIVYGPEQGLDLFRFQYHSFQRSIAVTAGALTAVLLCAALIVLYHACRQEERPEKPIRQAASLRAVAGRIAFMLCTIVLFFFAGESELGGLFPDAAQKPPQIVAHRAGGAFAPENTLAALEQAIRDGADQAEIDVQQLADGTLVILHDTNFLRTTGTNLDVQNADAQTVQRLDAGSFFSYEYKGEKVPTLEAMLQAAKGRIRLMIELKASAHTDTLVQSTLDLIEANDMTQECSIASMDSDILKLVKQRLPEIPTVYITALLISNQYDLPYVDWYSVETTSLTASVVREIHWQGKQVYAWTANSEKNLLRLRGYDLDGVITDSVLLAQFYMTFDLERFMLDGWIAFLFPQ